MSEQAKELIMLRPQFKDHVDANDDVLEVRIEEWLAAPFVPLILSPPEFACQFSGAVFPAPADSHALIQLDAHIGERTLPDVILLEFSLNSGSQGFRGDFEEVFHSVLRVRWMDFGVSPDLVECVLDIVDESADLPKLKGLQF